MGKKKITYGALFLTLTLQQILPSYAMNDKNEENKSSKNIPVTSKKKQAQSKANSKEISFSGKNLTSQQFKNEVNELAASKLKQAERIDLSSNDLGNRSVPIILSLVKSSPSLKYLNISWNNFKTEDVDEILNNIPDVDIEYNYPKSGKHMIRKSGKFEVLDYFDNSSGEE